MLLRPSVSLLLRVPVPVRRGRRLVPSNYLCSRLFSTSAPNDDINSNDGNRAETTLTAISALDEHEKRVAAAQALVLERTRQRQRPPSSNQTKSEVHVQELLDDKGSSSTLDETAATRTTSTASNASDKDGNNGVLSPIHMHTIANSIQHWCSKDPAFFYATMQALNLSALAPDNSNSSNSLSSPKQQNHPLSSFVNQYRQLYYDSIADFRTHIVEELPPSPALQAVFEQLVEAGFGDPAWSKRYRQVRGYKARKQQMRNTYQKQLAEVERRQEVLRLAEKDWKGLLLANQKSAQQHKQRILLEQQRLQHPERKILRNQFMNKIRLQQQKQQNTHDESSSSQSSSIWSTFTSWFSSSSPAITPSAEPTVLPDVEPPEASDPLDGQQQQQEQLVFFDPFATPSNRQRKKLRTQRIVMEFLEREVQDAETELAKSLQASNTNNTPDTLRFPFDDNPQEYERARAVVHEAREVVCQELAQFIGQRHAQLIEQYQRLDAKTDLTKPHEWFSYARLDRRKIIFHSGPTNSGKTYNALERLKEANEGLYLGPLRLLAAEVYENLTSDGIYTNLFTGQERREIAFSTHAAATVEMVNLAKEYDVVVIDEIQMISDVTRGAAWTKALLGLRCKEIHVCGGPEARTIVKKMADACGDDFELKEYERFSPLVIASNGSLTQDPTKTGAYKHVQPGDCVVAFSRNDIFAIKREIEKTTPYRCCVIYGKLPPQTRADQARRFNDPDSGYDILVASDAIGMGLNLNIRRIIFNTIFKYNGEEVVRLSHSEIKQISGRAGRRNSPYPNGEVTCRDPRDLPYIRKCLFSEITQIEKAALLPTSEHIELFSEGLQDYDVVGEDDTDLHKILRQFSAMATVKGDFFLGRQTEMQTIAKSLKGVPLSLKDAYTMCLSPTSEHSLYLLLNFAWKLARGQVCGLPSRTVPKAAKSFDDLSYLCNVYGDADLFLWLQFKFPPSNAVEHQAALARKETTLEFINQALANTDRLDLNHDYIRMALRNRANWESDNGSFEDTNDDSDHFGDSSSTTSTRRKDSGGGRRTFDGEDDDDDDAYASFSERRQAHG